MFSVSRTALETDPSPLVNVVTAHYHPDGFTNDITDDDPHSVEVVAPPEELITVLKWYDLNFDGINDGPANGEPLLQPVLFPPGWLVEVSLIDNGNFINPIIGSTPFSQLLANGDYLILEAQSTGPDVWFPTNHIIPPVPTHFISDGSIAAASSTSITLDGSDDTLVEFGNVCIGPGGGHTPGFWGNRNGGAIFLANNAVNLALLNGLNLVDANGADADFANYSEFRAWLRTASATNMAYQLSAHLASMALNVENGFVSGSSFVFTEAFGFVTIDFLMTQADNSLGSFPDTTEPHPQRQNQTDLKSGLGGGNNNDTFVQETPCDYEFPSPTP